MKKTTLSDVKHQLFNLNRTIDDHNSQIRAKKCEIDLMLADTFNNDPIIKKGISEVENSKEFMFTEIGDVASWSRFELPEKYREVEEYFDRWLSDAYGYIYHEKKEGCYETLVMDLGPDTIIINSDGDVYQENNFFISRKDYETKEERNRLIEEHMEKTGCYPGVFKCDNYDNLIMIDTRGKELNSVKFATDRR